MKNLLIFSIISLFTFCSVSAQEPSSFYATMSLSDAKKLKKEYPEEIYILEKSRNEAAVMLTEEGGHLLHEQILTHGPGYIYASTRVDAIKNLQSPTNKKKSVEVAFTITQDAIVKSALELVNTQNIADHIQELENYGTRFHEKKSAIQSANDLKTKWEEMAAAYGRTDVSVRLVDHEQTPMPSVIMTIEGSEFPDQFVIVGGHLDSTSRQGNDNAPGADDDASGIATITEAARVLFAVGFEPKRTIEVMAYAAEEVGLVGSSEIAKDYRERSVDVLAVGQFDMTNYNGSAKDIYFIQDNTDEDLNTFFISLIDYYNASGIHGITYGTSVCNYACSDHDSWDNQGYRASFPFEANIAAGASNPNIHTAGDTYELTGTADHATKFTKLCTEFLIEVAKGKTNTLLTKDVVKNGNYTILIQNNLLRYAATDNSSPVDSITMHDVNGQTVFQKFTMNDTGEILLENMVSGVYIVTLQLKNSEQISKKIVVK